VSGVTRRWPRSAPGQRRDEGGEHGPVRPIQARSWIGATQDGDLVPQHKQLDILGGGRTAHQQDQPKHLPEDQVEQAQRHAGIMSDRRSPLAAALGEFWHPARARHPQHGRRRTDQNRLYATGQLALV
jgi:hypothetical protein